MLGIPKLFFEIPGPALLDTSREEPDQNDAPVARTECAGSTAPVLVGFIPIGDPQAAQNSKKGHETPNTKPTMNTLRIMMRQQKQTPNESAY